MAQKPKRSVETPKPTFQEAPVIFSNVQLTEDEDVQWSWTHTAKGSYVSGYQIIKKEPNK